MKKILFLIALLLSAAFAAAISYTQTIGSECIYFDNTDYCTVDNYYCDNDLKFSFLGQCREELAINPYDDMLVKEFDNIAELRNKPWSSCDVNVYEGDLIKVDWESYDPDFFVGPQSYLSHEYNGVLRNDGSWQTQIGDAGHYTTSATVSDGEYDVTSEFCINVFPVNKPAKVELSKKRFIFHQEDTVTIPAVCSDEDGDATKMKFSGWMNTLRQKTSVRHLGEYDVDVTCKDANSKGSTTKVKIIILNKNRAPKISWSMI